MSSRDTAKYALLSAASGALAGAIGATAASGQHPIIKGALVTGAIGGVLALLEVAFVTDPNAPKQVGASGAPLRFP